MALKDSILNPLRRLLVSSDGSGSSFINFLSGKRKKTDAKSLLDEYKEITYACITAIAEECAKYQLILYRPDDVKKLKPIVKHPLIDLLKNPHEGLSQYELLEASASFYELNGEVFWYLPYGSITKKPKEIYFIAPHKIKVSYDDKTGKVIGYVYCREDGNDIPLDTNEVMHLKSFNPHNQYRGMGTVEAAMLYIETESSTSEFQRNFLGNQASPSGIVSLKGTISKEAFAKAKRLWKETNGGLENAGKTLFIRKGEVEFTKIGLSIADLNLSELKQDSKQSVREMFRVPKAILGDTESTGLGRANVEAIEYIFIKRTIEPKLTRFDGFLTSMLMKYFSGNGDLIVGHQSQIPQDEAAELAGDVAGVDKWVTRNEIRARRGYDSIDGGDELYIAFNQTIMGEEPPAPQDTAGTSGDNAPVDNADTTDTGKSFGKISITKKIPLRVEIKKAKTDSKIMDLVEELDKVVALGHGKYSKKIIAAVRKQEKYVLSQEDINAAFITKIPEGEVGLSATLSVDNLIEALLKESGELTFDHLGLPTEDFLINQATRDAAAAATDRLAKSFDQETVSALQKQIAISIENKETTEQLTKRIENVYSEAKGYRAERIAETESHKYVNEANASAYSQAGYTDIVWRARAGACEFCDAMDGTVVQIGQAFIQVGGSIDGTDGGKYVNDYADIKYADAHPHCDCYLEPVKS